VLAGGGLASLQQRIPVGITFVDTAYQQYRPAATRQSLLAGENTFLANYTDGYPTCATLIDLLSSTRPLTLLSGVQSFHAVSADGMVRCTNAHFRCRYLDEWRFFVLSRNLSWIHDAKSWSIIFG
jgi:hypothetical protein